MLLSRRSTHSSFQRWSWPLGTYLPDSADLCCGLEKLIQQLITSNSMFCRDQDGSPGADADKVHMATAQQVEAPLQQIV